MVQEDSDDEIKVKGKRERPVKGIDEEEDEDLGITVKRKARRIMKGDESESDYDVWAEEKKEETQKKSKKQHRTMVDAMLE